MVIQNVVFFFLLLEIFGQIQKEKKLSMKVELLLVNIGQMNWNLIIVFMRIIYGLVLMMLI